MTHKIAILAVTMLITLAIVISSQRPQSTSDGASGKPAQAVRNDEKATNPKATAIISAKTEKQELPNIDAAPRWQDVRFVKGDFKPEGIASAGKFAAVLVSPVAKDPLKRFLPQTPLQLLESQDGGATWSWGPKFPEYTSASVALDSDGTCVVLGLAGAAPIPETMDHTQRTQFPEPKRAEYRIRPLGGTFSAPEIVWSETDGSQRYYGEPCVFLVKGAVWAFALKPQHRTLMHHVAAYGENRSCPKPVGEWGAGGETAAWASDSQNAGFCVQERDGLKHYFTANSGKSWESVPIPFGQDPGSNRQYEIVAPISMSRENQTISVLVNATFQATSGDIMSLTSQDFMISSSDQGRTWQIPTIVDEPVSLMQLLRGVPCIHAHQGNVAVSYSSKAGFKEVFNTDDKKPAKKTDIDAQDRVIVRSSVDLGKTWFDQHALDSLSDHASDVRIGGDERSLHVAIYKKDPQNEGYLVIRSYTSGQWAAANEVPAWYKETPVPAPTKEDF